MTPADLSAAPGWFGKLPALGDFASRRLPADWTQGCDRWLSDAMQVSQQQLGERWKETYLHAPLWRFAWAPGVVDTQWWFGVLMASCDRVGRYFPLVVAQARTRPPTDRFALDHLDLWWKHMADATLQTLSDASTIDLFEDALGQAPPWPSSRLRTWVSRQGTDEPERYAVEPGATLVELAGDLASQGLAQRLEGRTLWWPMPSPDGASRCTVHHGLPAAQSFAGLLMGTF